MRYIDADPFCIHSRHAYIYGIAYLNGISTNHTNQYPPSCSRKDCSWANKSLSTLKFFSFHFFFSKKIFVCLLAAGFYICRSATCQHACMVSVSKWVSFFHDNSNGKRGSRQCCTLFYKVQIDTVDIYPNRLAKGSAGS